MDKKIHIDLDTLKFIYGSYKAFLVPILVIVVSLALFIKIVIPQVKDVVRAREEAKLALQKIAIVKNNLEILSRVEDLVLDSQVQTLTSALPLSKDFGAILNSLSIASQKASVSLGDYEFKVGDLSKIDQRAGKYPFLELSLTVNGEKSAVTDFIDILEKVFPLSEVTSLEMRKNSLTIQTVFYYKPVPRPVRGDLPIKPISQKDLSLVRQIEESRNLLTPTFGSPFPSTSSGSLGPF